MKYRAVIFDLDDTLLITSAIKWAHHKAVAKQFYNIELTDEVLAEHWGKPFEPMMAIFYQHADTPDNMLKANLSLEDQFPKGLQNDALDAVDRLLKAGVKVGLVTSITNQLALKDLVRHGFPASKFFILQGADDEPAHKPDPKVFNAALKLLKREQIKPEQVVYIGDALIDYYAARDAGIGFMGVTTGFVTQKQFEAAGAKAASTLAGVFRNLEKAS